MSTTFNTPPAPLTPPAPPAASFIETGIDAKFRRRLVGFYLDFHFRFLLGAVILISQLLAFLGMDFLPIPDGFVGQIVIALLPNVVFSWILFEKGQTPGMRLVRVSLIDDATGTTPGLRKIIVREVASWLSFALLGLGYIVAIFHSENKTLHDIIAGTSVVED